MATEKAAAAAVADATTALTAAHAKIVTRAAVKVAVKAVVEAVAVVRAVDRAKAFVTPAMTVRAVACPSTASYLPPPCLCSNSLTHPTF